MRYEFHPEALEEYREAANWYGNREPDLALRFVSEVEDAIERILDGPERWRIIEEDVRRCLTHVFPYSILYTIESEFVLIMAVAPCARKPGYWKERIARS
ncbi:MAG TPA: plasmid stabilization protein [Blastocatellia bacterium]|nr:plasmid stabilization protein [Blastocatellia bacterium]